MSILEEIVAHKRIELEQTKDSISPRQLYKEVEEIMSQDTPIHSLAKALVASSTGIIAEFKRKSPSLGWIKPNTQPEDIVPKYAENGATAVSILTDEYFFGGELAFIQRVRPLIDIPILRKEFIIDEYQLFEARKVGADAILLIAACLTQNKAKSLAKMARELQLDVLMEVHDENELDYINDYVNVAGVNNRNLHLFKTDIQTSVILAEKMPSHVIKISESGIRSATDIQLLRSAGFRGFLMGERFMKEENPHEALAKLIKEISQQL